MQAIIDFFKMIFAFFSKKTETTPPPVIITPTPPPVVVTPPPVEQPKPPVETHKPDLMLEMVNEERKWVGVREHGSNAGPEVERFQRSVPGYGAQGQSWCMAFQEFCVKEVEMRFGVKSPIYRSELCTAVWAHSPAALRSDRPVPGAIVIWQHGSGPSGHTGMVTRVIDNDVYETIEGNTGPQVGSGPDGVYVKTHHMSASGTTKRLGFLRPFI